MRLSVVIFIRKSWSNSFNNGIVYIRLDFKCICSTISRHYTELFYKFFTRATESARSMEGCNFRNILPINVPKYYGGRSYVFWQETFKVIRILLPGSWFYPSITDIVETMKNIIQGRQNHCDNCIKVKVSRRTQKNEIYVSNEGSGLAFFSTDPGTFSEVMFVMKLEQCWEEKDLTNQNLLTTLSAYTLSWYTPTWLSTISLAT